MSIKVYSDSTASDFDKAIAYHPRRDAELLSFRLEYTASATAGNRTVEVQIRDADDDVIWATEIVTVFVASDVRIVNFSPGANLIAPADAGDEGSQHISAGLPFGGNIRAVATAGGHASDTMIMHALVRLT